VNQLVAIEELSICGSIATGGHALLERISLSVEQGDSLAIVGESGSGKTLICRSILGRTPLGSTSTGSVYFRGRDVLSLSRQELRTHRSQEVALIVQDPSTAVSPFQRIGTFITEQVRHSKSSARNDIRAETTKLIRKLGFTDTEKILNSYPHMLSGGMLQRIIIASALLVRPSLIIADEATSALDPINQAETIRLLLELAEEHNVALILVTHDLDLAVAACNRVAVVLGGKLIECQPTSTMHSLTHPYTAALAACRPRLDSVERPLPTVPKKFLQDN
jgi:ABC-type dipeptide/oligopeptide/nickel transport system ATPase component